MCAVRQGTCQQQKRAGRWGQTPKFDSRCNCFWLPYNLAACSSAALPTDSNNFFTVRSYIFAFCRILAAAHDSDSRYMSAEEQSRELARSIRREVGKLSEQWNNLIDRSDNWKHRLDEYMTVSLPQHGSARHGPAQPGATRHATIILTSLFTFSLCYIFIIFFWLAGEFSYENWELTPWQRPWLFAVVICMASNLF